jgi:galactokinase
MTTPESLASALVERGLDVSERAAKAAMFERILRAFTPDTAREPQHAWWVPGRLELFGKHTDYAGGRTLVCAVPRGFVVVARPRGDGELHVVDAKRDERFVLRPSDTGVHGGWRHYVEVVARRFGRNFPGASLGADLSLESDLPRASGMSSSSALVVGVATALVKVAGLDRHPEWRANVRSAIDAASYFGCVENGMTYGTLAGDAGVGTHGGSEDHAAIVTGVPGMMSAFRFVPMRHLRNVALPRDWQFALSACGVAARKTGAEMEKYNRLAEGARVLLAVWNASQPAADSLGSLAAAPARAGLLRDLIRRAQVAAWPSDALERRLDHFIREDARVGDAVEAFAAADRARVGQLAVESQSDAENLLGNQVPESIALARSALDAGAFASCSFGAGFGGSVWALVDGTNADEFADRWSPGAFLAAPGPPVSEL